MARKQYRESTRKIVAEALALAAQNKKAGWTKADSTAALKEMLDSPTGETTYQPPHLKPKGDKHG